MIPHTEGSRPSFAVPLLPHLLTIDFSNRLFVRFPMVDNKRLVTVHIAVGWLKQRAERDRMRTDNLALLFNFYRDGIEAAASAKYDRGYCDGADVVLTARDLAGESERLLPRAEAITKV
jgi:hypothetical protein